MRGGKRQGAGRPKGKPTQKTLEKMKVLEAFNQRVMQKADALFNAQFSLAVGSAKVFRIDEEGTGKNKKRIHTLVTDADEIKALLDEHDGGPGEVDGSFYYITTTSPDNRALDSLLNRALGRPTEHKIIESRTPEQVAEYARERLREVLSEHPDLTKKERAELVKYAAEKTGIDEADLVM